jgi:hypothetical protein
MTTYVGGGQVSNAYSDGVSGGFIPGDAATGHLLRDVSDFMNELEPTKTPVLSMIKKTGTVSQLKYEWGLERLRPHSFPLANNLTTTTTSLNLGTTHIKKVQKYMVLRIVNPTLGDEIVWCSADPNLSGGTITIVRGQGGTSDPGSTHTTTAVTSIEVIGIAEPITGVDHAISPYLYGDLFWNTIQRFAGGPKMDNIARFTPDLERKGDKLLGLIREEGINQKILLEKAILLGGRQAGAPSTPTPPLMGGIRYYLGTADSNNNVRTVSGNLGVYDFEEVMANVWGRYTNNVAKKCLVSMKTKRIINRLLNPFRATDNIQNTGLNLKFDTFNLETGDISFFEPHPWMPDGEIWGLDFEGMELEHYTGEGNGDWHVEINAKAGSYEWRTLVGVKGFKFEGEPRCWRITGFSTDLSQYPAIM